MARRWSRTALIVAAVAVAIAGGALVWLTRPGDEPARSSSPEPATPREGGAPVTPEVVEPEAAEPEAVEPAPPEPEAPSADETSAELLDMSIAALQQQIDRMDPESAGARRLQERLDRMLETRADELEAVDEDAVPGLDEYGPVHVGEGVPDEDLTAGDD